MFKLILKIQSRFKCHEKKAICWLMPGIPGLGNLRQDSQKSEASLGYKVRPCLKDSHEKAQMQSRSYLKIFCVSEANNKNSKIIFKTLH